jgi:hypothetical protein
MKKNLFVINEEEKDRILNMHETATLNQYLFEQQNTTQQPTTPTGTAPTTSATTPTTTASTKTASTRVATAKCPAGSSKCNEQGIKIQVKINDECPADVLNLALTNYPKAATGSAGSLKLKEDGIVGQGTIVAFGACKTHLVPKTQQSGTTNTTGGGGQQPVADTGSQVTADQYATLSA